MLHERLLDSLDSSSPLLFIEAVYGSGKRTLLQQWEAGGGNGHGEIRLHFDARRLPTDPAALTRMFWSALRHRLGHALPQLPADDAQFEATALRYLREIRRPVVVALVGADHLSERTVGVVLRLLDVGFRLIIAGFDLSTQIGVARRAGVYYSTMGDLDIRLSLAEARALVEEEGAELSEDALTAIYRATLGHPGMILASLRAMPTESASGVLTRDRAIGAFLAEEPLEQWPSGYAQFIAAMAHLARFTVRESAAVMELDDVTWYIDRFRSLALGRMAWSPALQERVFQWEEPIRLVIKQSLTPPGGDETEAISRVLTAARESHDDELLIATLVHVGELDQAETLLREKIWDVLPNTRAPLWSSLERISPLTLVDRPALLSARLRLSPHRSGSPVSERAARTAGRVMAQAADVGSPWGRIGNLAFAIEFALYAGERERLIDLFTRARGLIADLVASVAAEAATGREVSDLLLIADTVYRSGNTIPAAEIGRFAAQLIEVDPEHLDPRGERLAYARRLILHDHRARGLEDPFDPEPLLAGTQFLWRDGDIVVAGMSLMWDDFDDGNFGAADARLRIAADRVADPEGWPILMLMRAHLAVYRQAPGELEESISAYERSTLSEPGPFAQQSLSQMSRITDYLSKKAGRPIASPGFLPATPEPGRQFYPRTEFTVCLMEALYAVRADRPAAVRAALAQAVALSPRRDLGLYTLANATTTEVEALRDIAEGIPGGPRLRLERALQFAGNLHRPTVDLSEREREILELLREGATNPYMAKAMFVSVNTVKFHRANLMRKLDATSRDQLLKAADTLGV